MNISTAFRLKAKQANLDFIDVNLTHDNELFIDPRLIENQNTKFGRDAIVHIEAFWTELIKLIRSKKTANAVELLSGMKEPKETRLGYAVADSNGKNISETIKDSFLTALSLNTAVKSGVLSHLADTRLLVEDIGCDRISDTTTKIIKSSLISFTTRQCQLHGISVQEVVQRDIFDPNTLTWKQRTVKMPIFGNDPILFVPKDIVRLSSISNNDISSFYRFAIRNFIAKDTTMLKDVSPSGKDGKLLLRDIKATYPLSKDSLSKWVNKYGKLLVDYKSLHLKDRIRPATIEEIENVIYR